jgi:long-chain acyl-CoA synthetase
MAFVGSTLVPVPGMRIPAEMVGAIAKHRATGFAMVPAGIALLRRAGRDLLETVVDQLRYVEIASAAIAPDVRDWLLDTLPKTRVMHSYGLTEASRACVVDLRSEVGRRGSIGFASPNVEIEIRDATNRRVAAGVEGEIHVCGAMIMREYWRQPERTSEVLRDGWLRTGDIAHMDADGAIHLRGRSSDMINVGGMKVAPDEVERLLLEHPDVTDAACVGIADSRGISGERVKAFVVCKKSVDPGALLEWIRGKGLETYKVPVVVEESVTIPRTQNGKILRRLLKG